MYKINFLRLALLLFFFALILLIGIFRLYFIVNLVNFDLPFIISRDNFDEKYPMAMSDILKTFLSDPRWFSNAIYILTSFFAGLGTIHFAYQKKEYIRITILVYLFVALLLLSLVAFSMFTNNYQMGYSLAQDMNMLIQGPLPVIFLLAAFYLAESFKKQNN